MSETLVPRIVRALNLRRFFRWWGARALAANAISYGVDVTTLMTCLHGVGLPPSVSVMAGVLLGWTSNFFLSRRFAFRQHHAPLAPQALRFGATVLVAMAIEGTLVGLVVSYSSIPTFLAKVGVDLGVFSVAMPLVLRHLVFARKAPPAEAPPAPAPS